MIETILMLAETDPVAHVVDKPIIIGQFMGMQMWWLSNATVMLVLSAIVTALLVIPAAKRINTGKQRTLDDFRTQGTLANLVESVCVYLRGDVFQPVLQDQTDRFAPMLWTFFWFILVCNLMGLVPFTDLSLTFYTLFIGDPHHAGFSGIGGTATQSIWVTGALACVAFLFYNGIAFFKDPLGYFMHLTGGAPWFMWIIMIPVEIAGTFIKPFALAIRLFANMTGGHLVIAVLLSFVGPLINTAGAGKGMVIIPVLGAAAINMLEILVAFIQAYIFTFLTTLFLGQLVVHEHEDHAEHDEHHDTAHEHLPHATPVGVDQTHSIPLTESKE